ncbi:aminoglycoside phosphotransferase family protein [Micromonosporaceae bacterium Da 78-11]
MDEPEILTGGGVNEVVRIGDVVRRPAGAWTPLVHDLLRHLRTRGFTAAPRPHEITPDGYEILDYLPGDVSNYPATPAAASPPALVSAARLLRAYHDATVDHVAPLDGWQLPARQPVEVLCHGDYAPHNCVLTGTTVTGIIDFDVAHPGPRVWDVAYAVYRWVPLTAPDNADGFGSTAGQAARLRTFCDSYGLDDAGRAVLIATVIDRLTAMVAFMRAQAAAGNAAFAGHLAAGHHRQYLGDADYLRRARPTFDAALLSR